MRYSKKAFWAILGTCLLTLIVACGGSDDSAGTTTETPALTREGAERQAGFTLLIPSYLPTKADPDPQYIVYANNHGVDVRYSPAGDGKEAESPTIIVHEQRGGNLVLNVPGVTETIAGTSVEVSEVGSGGAIAGATAAVTGLWAQGELKLSVEVRWGSHRTDPVELTDEMRTIARRVIESMINQQPSPQSSAPR